MKGKRLGVALVGFAGSGKQDHQNEMYGPAFAAHPEFRLVAVVDTYPNRTGPPVASRYDVPERSLEDVLADPQVDVVCVCVPFEQRVSVLTAALRADKHALVDKPMALTLADCDAIAAAAGSLVCMPAHHHRYHRSVQAARAALAAGRIGLPWNVQADFLVTGGPPCPLGELTNLGLYPVDVIRSLVRLPVERVYATVGSAFGGKEDLAVLCLDHARGLTSTITVGRTPDLAGRRGLLHRYRISGSHGLLLADAARPAAVVHSARGRSENWLGADTVTAMLDELARAIRAGRPTDLGPADARAAVAVVLAAQQSAARGTPITPDTTMAGP